MNHKEALEALTERMLGGDPSSDRVLKAISHVAGCAECLRALGASARLLQDDKDLLARLARVISCEWSEKTLPELAELTEEEAAMSFPLEMEHLRSCRECQAEYCDLVHVRELEASDTFGEFPDLGRAVESLADPLWEVAQGARRLVRRIGLVVRGAVLEVAELPKRASLYRLPPLIPEGSLVNLGRALTVSAGCRIMVPDAQSSMDVVLELRPRADGRIECMAAVRDERTGAWLPMEEGGLLSNTGGRKPLRSGKDLAYHFVFGPGITALYVACRASKLEIPLQLRSEQ